MAMAVKSIVVGAELAGRVDRAVRKLTGLSHSAVRGLLDHGCVTVNGRPCDDAGVKSGDAIEVRYDPHRRYRERARPWRDDAFRIVFEDRHLIVVDKAAGVLTVPAHAGETGTLVHAVARYLARRRTGDRACPVHRLDRDASGLLVFGKSREVADELQRQFEARKPERQYAAIVKGRVPAQGTFESRLASASSLRRYSTDRPGDGELAITHYRLERAMRGASVVEVWLETGRRNQIRVHFAEAGHPVLGDTRYRPELSAHPRWRAKRLALHAAVLGFRHPVTGEPLRFESPLPPAMKAFAEE